MDFIPISSEADYKAALAHIEMLMHSREKTSDDDLLNKLKELAENYERKRYRIKQPKQVVSINLDRQGITQQERF